MFKTSIKSHNLGFSIAELIVVLAISMLLTAVVLTSFMQYRKGQAFSNDVQVIVSALNQARSQTLSSQNAMQYGVHFSSTTITLFTGTTFSPADVNNKNFPLETKDLNLVSNLGAGGLDVVFQRLTGEASNFGDINLYSSSSDKIKTIKIYRTGIIE